MFQIYELMIAAEQYRLAAIETGYRRAMQTARLYRHSLIVGYWPD